MELELEYYYKIIKNPHTLKFVDNDKLAALMLDYKPTLHDIEFYMKTLVLYVQTTSFTFDNARILSAIERCKKVVISDEEEEIMNDLLEYFIRLFGLFLDSAYFYPAKVFNSIFDYIDKYPNDDIDEDHV